MKKLCFITSCLMVTSFSYSYNASETLPFEDCFEVAFDYMEIAAASGLDAEGIAAAGEYYYCKCEPSCVWEVE